MKKKTREKLNNDLKEYNKILLNGPFEPKILCEKAHVLSGLKRYQEALKIYNLLLEKFPENTNLWIKKTQILFKMGGYKERNSGNNPWDITEIFTFLIKDKPIVNVDENLNETLNISFKLMKDESVDHAKFFGSFEEYARAWEILGRIFYSLGRLDQYIEAHKASSNIYRKIKRSIKEFERKINAISNYNKMISEDNKNADSWYNIGNRLEKASESKMAREAYQRAAQLYYIKGEASIKSHHYLTAYNSFEMALKIKPELKSAWTKSGYVLIKQGKFRDAIKNCDRALRLNSKCAESWYFRGIALTKLKMYDDSLISYDKALEIYPEYVEALNGKGRVLTETQHYDEALRCYEKAINLKSEDSGLWYSKCFVLRKLGRYEEALEACEKSLRIKSNDYKALYNKAYILERLNRNEESKLTYNLAANSCYELGNYFYINSDFNTALKFYENVLRIIPTHVSSLGRKGNILAKQGKIKDALILIDKAIDVEPNCAESWFIGSQIYYQDGNIKEARECYEKSTQLDKKVINLNPSFGEKISTYYISNENIIDESIKAKKGKDDSVTNWYDEDNAINRYGLYK